MDSSSKAPAAPRRVWFERKFALGLPADSFPDLIERIRGTPARLEERVRGIDPATLVRRAGEAWSIQENVGHLGDLESLWAGRLDDFLQGLDRLRVADLQNRKTHEAGHNEAAIEDLLARFRRERFATISRLDSIRPEDVAR